MTHHLPPCEISVNIIIYDIYRVVQKKTPSSKKPLNYRVQRVNQIIFNTILLEVLSEVYKQNLRFLAKSRFFSSLLLKFHKKVLSQKFEEIKIL